ncbi:hypothetical protein MBRA1_003275 [Malassezia brasiliensis]|uniref:RRM domain-containing protein n=1 Tax=Malassezia brasiliensis TaxID=1821822 RepID=A0AAF0IPU3_9BASI|nr:hypothetical protein MBRA1_003275 [Malassezia brasiliensis]
MASSPERVPYLPAERTPPPTRDARPNVYVYGLTDKVDDRHLDEIFGQYGRIARLRVRRDTLRRSAVLQYDRIEDAEMAVEHMDHGQIDGVFIRATLSEDPRLEGPRMPPRRAERSPPRRVWGRAQRDDHEQSPRENAWNKRPDYDAPRT